ncbi:ACR3 family arsenite efflux transporter [Salipaludibacillus sp. CUR1]|uniref:ACR3 family arsenite efflux transporter n=1 Tax=Salipaludibacillus sp. CUR1 TaxID=2820003 RepID=UPI001E310ADF|nr:ACR3 family arsenite efflux transporter [Salipaludibacillus sp. CUR1]MCE7791664.1 ACR3 family arsenite efflux transporter [Salipaludibacillus sp. CUR1]
MSKEVDQQDSKGGIGFFERYLSVWVALCIIIGVAVGQFIPAVPETLSQFEYAQVSIPVAILIWLMIYPMMAQIDFSSIVNAGRKPKGLAVTLVVNWLIKPFTMFFFAWVFFRFVFSPFIPEALATEYIAGAVLLGAAPCTAMVFVWSYLTKGNAGYTLVQVSVNNLILIFAYGPIVMVLLRMNNVIVPFDTIFLSILLFIIIPLAAGYISRVVLIKRKGLEWFENVYLKAAGKFTIAGLLLTLIIIFSFQGEVILQNPFHIGLIAVPLVIQTLFIFVIAYFWAKKWRIEHSVAAPAAMIGTSNFFELAVAASIALFGLNSGATLVTVVGVLVEVPLMLFLVRIANNTREWFPESSLVKNN